MQKQMCPMSAGNDAPMDCIGQRCAWLRVGDEQCAVLTLSYMFEVIADSLDGIRQDMPTPVTQEK